MKQFWKAVFAGLALTTAFLVTPASAQGPAPTDPHMQWWRDARFGMFIHWGPISVMGQEIGWSRSPSPFGPNPGGIPAVTYDNLYKQFNPNKFDAKAIVALAKAAGMKYIVLTTKHHDGFCEWDSKVTDYKITSPKSPYGKDIVKQLADATHAAGLHWCVYYSQLDTHQPDYKVNQPAYDKYFHDQVHELQTNYGKVDLVWFDGDNHSAEFWDADNLFRDMRAVNPNVVINNRCGLPGDYYTPEQRVGAYDDQRAWETCMTIGDQWSYKPNDRYKSAVECVQTLAKCVGGDGNLLLNIGPQPDGQVDPTQADRLKSIAAWMKTHSSSVTGTRGGPYKPASSYVSTRKGNTVYVHVLRWTDNTITLPAMPKRIVRSRLIGKGRASVTQNTDGVTIFVPPQNQDAADTVIALELDGSAMDLSPIAPEAPQITASASNVYQNSGDYGADKAFDDDGVSRWASDTGTNPVWLQADFVDPKKVQGITIKEAYANRVRKFEIQYQAPGSADWITLTTGSKLGEGYAAQFAPVTAKAVRLNILEATDSPTISEISFVTAK